VTAFTTLDTVSALRLVSMFHSMERGGQLPKYYHKCVRAGLLQRSDSRLLYCTVLYCTEGQAPVLYCTVLY